MCDPYFDLTLQKINGQENLKFKIVKRNQNVEPFISFIRSLFRMLDNSVTKTSFSMTLSNVNRKNTNERDFCVLPMWTSTCQKIILMV
jgi:hypothetical protein